MFSHLVSRFRRWPLWGQFLAASLPAVALRHPMLLVNPRFWAEEGQVFFPYARLHGWLDALTIARFGYVNLTNNMSGLAAAAMPLPYAPYATLAISFAMLLVGAAIIAGLPDPLLTPKAKWILLFLYLVILPCQEIWLNTINLQSYYGAILFLIGLSSVPTAPAGRWATLLYLSIASLSGPNAALAAPAFAARAWREKSKARWAQAGVLCAGGLLQASVFAASYLRGVHEVKDRFSLSSSIASFFPVLFVKSFALPLAGVAAANAVGRLVSWTRETGFLWLLSAALAAFCLRFFWRLARSLPRPIAVFWALYFAAQFGAILLFSRGDKFLMANAAGGERYFYSTNFVLYAAVFYFSLCALKENELRKARRIVYWSIFIGALHFWRPFADGPSWRAEAAKAEAESGYQPEIWPPGWRANLTDAPANRPSP